MNQEDESPPVNSSRGSLFAMQAAITILLSAFLLFQVQPIISRMILPWFGGTPAVWTTAMLFFQVMLLAGYAYAHLISRVQSVRLQAIVHFVLLVVAVLMLPITPDETWKPIGETGSPTPKILLMLAACVGVPYFALASTGPLVQAWFARWYPGRSPYRLYALSNAGSLGALLSYPFLFEPTFTISKQSSLWAFGFAAYAICCGAMALMLWRQATALQTEISDDRGADRESSSAKRSPPWNLLLWIVLPIVPSVMLLAVTNHLCQDVAVIPFLWIAPLSIYLISFIICFDREAWYRRGLFALLTMASVLLLCGILEYERVDLFVTQYLPWLSVDVESWADSIVVQTALWLSMLFFVCMLCHGEVVRLKPSSDRLTAFYLSISTGGALGGVFVAVLCPYLFNNFFELGAGLVAAFLYAAFVFVNAGVGGWLSRIWKRGAAIAIVGGLGVLVFTVAWSSFISQTTGKSSMSTRSFYGILKIHNYKIEPTEEFDAVEGTYERRIVSGRILHGKQFTDEPRMPTSYFSYGSGLGIAMQFHHPDQNRRVGVIGLGAGTIAAYGKAGDTYRFYEINPSVTEIATKYFTFLSDCPAKVEVVPGDGRLSMESESPQAYDVLVVDAFSGDAIPVHLLTVEAFEVYQKHLKPDGILAVHVSNRYVELNGVIARLAEEIGMSHLFVVQNERSARVNRSRWMLLSPSAEALNQPDIRAAEAVDEVVVPVSLWTDDYTNIIETLK